MDLSKMKTEQMNNIESILRSCLQTKLRPPTTFSEDPEDDSPVNAKRTSSSRIVTTYSEGDIPMWPPPPPPDVSGSSGSLLMASPHIMQVLPENFGLSTPTSVGVASNVSGMPMAMAGPTLQHVNTTFAPNRGAAGFGHNMSELMYYRLGMKRRVELPISPTGSEDSNINEHDAHPPRIKTRIPIPGARKAVPGIRPSVVSSIRPGAVVTRPVIPKPQARPLPGVVVRIQGKSDDERQKINRERARREAIRAARVLALQTPVPLPQTRANNIDPNDNEYGYDSSWYGYDHASSCDRRRKTWRKRKGKGSNSWAGNIPLKEGAGSSNISLESKVGREGNVKHQKTTSNEKMKQNPVRYGANNIEPWDTALYGEFEMVDNDEYGTPFNCGSWDERSQYGERCNALSDDGRNSFRNNYEGDPTSSRQDCVHPQSWKKTMMDPPPPPPVTNGGRPV